MAEFTRELFVQSLAEWERFPATFHALPLAEQAEFLEEQGYDSLQDLLAHVAVWWEEGRSVIRETLAHGDRGSRKYDFAKFNAAAVARFQGTPEDEFMSWYEAERGRIRALLNGLSDSEFAIRRVQNWLNGVVLEHLKEHTIDAPRFLVIDILHREWGDYVKDFRQLEADQQVEFLKRQGYVRFPELLGHVIAWWEHGIGVIEASASDGAANVEDVDAFNAQAVQRFGNLGEAEVVAQFDDTRLTLANLVDMLPDEVLGSGSVQEWLRADAIRHYFEHRL